ncbi:hypothetical protein HK104_002426, partial [Borealophlyctis nickersoniae]
MSNHVSLPPASPISTTPPSLGPPSGGVGVGIGGRGGGGGGSGGGPGQGPGQGPGGMTAVGGSTSQPGGGG